MIEGYETNWLYLIGNNRKLAEKRDRVYLECLEGKDKDGGGGGGGMLLCRRVMMVSSLPYAYGQVGSMIFFSFFFVYRQLGSNKQAGYISCIRSFY